MEIPLPELGLRVIILAGRRGSSPYHKGVFPGGSGMLRLRQWQLLAFALLACLAPLGCGSSGHAAAGSAVDGGSATTGGKSTPSGSVTTGGGGAPGSNGSTAPALPTPSTLPTYNQNTVSPTTKPKRHGSGVISLGNIGSPTVDSQHPNHSAGHLIPQGSISPHCILVYNWNLPRALTIVSVSFQVDVPGSSTAGPLQFVADNTEQNCGWLTGSYGAPLSVRAPTCGGKTLPPLPHTGPPYSGPGCVLRVDFTAPDSNVERTGHFNFILQTQCVDSAVAPCNGLARPPTAAHPVTVRWSPGPFYVVFCGRPLSSESEADAAEGKCPDESTSASTSSSSPVASSSAAVSPSS